MPVTKPTVGRIVNLGDTLTANADITRNFGSQNNRNTFPFDHKVWGITKGDRMGKALLNLGATRQCLRKLFFELGN